MQNICILGGTCPYSTADISHYQNDHNKSSNIKDGFVDKLLPAYMTKQIFEQNSVPEIIFYLKIGIVTSFKILLNAMIF